MSITELGVDAAEEDLHTRIKAFWLLVPLELKEDCNLLSLRPVSNSVEHFDFLRMAKPTKRLCVINNEPDV